MFTFQNSFIRHTLAWRIIEEVLSACITGVTNDVWFALITLAACKPIFASAITIGITFQIDWTIRITFTLLWLLTLTRGQALIMRLIHFQEYKYPNNWQNSQKDQASKNFQVIVHLGSLEFPAIDYSRLKFSGFSSEFWISRHTPAETKFRGFSS